MPSVKKTPSEGHILFAPTNRNDSYLVGQQGNTRQTGYGQYTPGMSVYLLPVGGLPRAENITPNPCGYPADPDPVRTYCLTETRGRAFRCHQYPEAYGNRISPHCSRGST
jgi:hypothetical protein